jgi:hypothetical protein
VYLLGYWAIHLAFTLVLLLPGVLIAATFGQRIPILLSAGFASLGGLGYLTFWVYLANPHAGRVFAVSAMALCGLSCLLLGVRLGRERWRRIRPFAEPTIVLGAASLFSLALGFLHGGRTDPIHMAQRRYVGLSSDNWLPYRFAQQLQADHRPLPHHLAGVWQSSDRPPLQTGIYLLQQGILGRDPQAMHYTTVGVLLQSLWILGVWAFLVAARVDRRAIALVLAVTLFSGFAILNTLYVWPKLVAAAFAMVALALLLNDESRTTSNRALAVVAGAAAGLDLGWGLLSHPGTAFAVIGVGVTMLILRRTVRWRFAAAAVAALVLTMVPWSLYQRLYDPPANRLSWGQLAPLTPYDPHKSTTSMIVQSYQNAGLADTVSNKLRNLEEPLQGLSVAAHTTASIVTSYVAPDRTSAAARSDDTRRFKDAVFLHVLPTLGFFGLGPVFLLLAWLRRRRADPDLRLAATAWLTVATTVVFWALVLFGPSATVIHAGTYVLVLLAMIGGVLSTWALSRWLAAGLAVVQAALTVTIYWGLDPAPDLPGVLSVHALPSAVSLVVAALVCTIGSLLLIGRPSPIGNLVIDEHRQRPQRIPGPFQRASGTGTSRRTARSGGSPGQTLGGPVE